MNRSLHLYESFVISCGTVTLDIDRSKVLVIYLRKTGEYYLPKGRKDVGEQLEATAVRETYEETGYIILSYYPFSCPPLLPSTGMMISDLRYLER
jgi:8-oxo-dGTP pyrophosphatase MutT (NUDIX family)